MYEKRAVSKARLSTQSKQTTTLSQSWKPIPKNCQSSLRHTRTIFYAKFIIQRPNKSSRDRRDVHRARAPPQYSAPAGNGSKITRCYRRPSACIHKWTAGRLTSRLIKFPSPHPPAHAPPAQINPTQLVILS